MSITYIPMGSMQVGPNGELIPTNISFTGGDGRPATFHQVVSSTTSSSGATPTWKMSDLTPVYSAPANYAVMEPIAVNSAGVLQLPVAGFSGGGQIVQAATSGGQIIQLQLQPQQQLQTVTHQHQQSHPQQQSTHKSAKGKGKQKTASTRPSQIATGSSAGVIKSSPESLQQFQIRPNGQLVHLQPVAAEEHEGREEGAGETVAVASEAEPAADSAANFTVIKVDNILSLQNAEALLAGESSSTTSSTFKDSSSVTGGKKKNKTTHACAICAKDFRSKGNLKRHHKDFHEDVQEKVTYHCDLCRKDFQNRFNLRRHRVGVHGADSGRGVDHPCDVCLKVFNYSDNLKRHRKNVHGIIGDSSVASSVDVDDRAGQTIQGQLLHFTSSGEIVAQLPVDNAVKTIGQNADSAAFVCEICNKNMQSGYNLKRHKLAVHKDTRILYGCDECEKNFTSITNYRRHKIMIHGPGKEAYKCLKCDKTLASKDGLKRHMESVHELLEKKFVCQTCGNRFLRKEYLSKHVKTHEFNYEVLPADTTTAS